MIIAATQTEIVVWSVLAFVYLCLLLAFVKTLLRGPQPIHWRMYRIGLFVDREPRNDDAGERSS